MGKNVSIWDLATGSEALRVATPEEFVKSLAFGAAGTRLLTGGPLGVRSWDVSSGANLTLFRSGFSPGLWVYCDIPRALCWRWDDGTLVTKKVDSHWEAVAPPRDRRAPQLHLSLNGEPALNQENGWIEMPYRVHNTGGDAFWVRVGATAPPAGKPHEGPPTVEQLATPPIFRLPAGTQADLMLRLALISAMHEPQGGTVDVGLTFTHAHGTAAAGKLAVSVAVPAPILEAATLERPSTFAQPVLALTVHNPGTGDAGALIVCAKLWVGTQHIGTTQIKGIKGLAAGATTTVSFDVEPRALEFLTAAKEKPTIELFVYTNHHQSPARMFHTWKSKTELVIVIDDRRFMIVCLAAGGFLLLVLAFVGLRRRATSRRANEDEHAQLDSGLAQRSSERQPD